MVKKILLSLGFFLLPSFCFASTFTSTDIHDGYLGITDQSSWALAHGASVANENGTSPYFGQDATDSGLFYVRRFGATFDFAPAITYTDLVIDSAEYHFYPTSKNDPETSCINLVAFAPANDVSFANGDLSAFGSTKLASDKTVSSISLNADNVLTLNSSGIAALQAALGGHISLGTRTCGDIANTTPTGNEYILGQTYSHGDANPPYLVVTYHYSAGSSSSSSSSSSLATGTGAWTGSGSMPIFHSDCATYTILSGTSSGSAFTFDSCAGYDYSISIPAMRAMQRQFAYILFSAIVILFKWSLILYLIFITSRWMFRIITHRRPPPFRSRRL